MCTSCTVPRKARLVSVTPDASEYTDLIGYDGKLNLPGVGSPHNWFSANGDLVSLGVREVAEADGKVTVKTGLGNTFTFRPLAS